VTWAQLAALDPTTTPNYFVGRLTWSELSSPELLHEQLVPATWPDQVVATLGPPPPGWFPAVERLDWTAKDRQCRYQPLTAGAILGPDSHWPHVFAVMHALADRFGNQAVRLVVAFD
jgi:hypothetical protein